MLRIFIASFTFLIALSISSHSANKQRRVALVIGNSLYDKTAVLANPQNDAKAIAEALAGLEFEVIEGLDLSKAEFDKKVLKFARQLKGADVGLFFYAGHALQVNGRNYLVPTDAELEDEAALDFSMVQLNTVMKQMERQKRTNLIFLDACRDNPLARNLLRAMGTRGGSISRGLARISTGIGTLIAFSTAPGSVAKDGSGINSPFTTALLENISTPGLNVTTLMQKVRQSVIKVTNGNQVPWDSSSLTGPFVFKKQVRERRRDGASGGGRGNIDIEAIYWQTIMDKEDASLFKEYMKDYPAGRFSRIAKLLVKRYEPKKVVMSVPRKLIIRKKPLIDREYFYQCVKKSFKQPNFNDAKVRKNADALLNYWDEHQKLTDLRWLAYVIATARHETDNTMSLIRERGSDGVNGKAIYDYGYVDPGWDFTYKKIGRAIGMGDELYQNPDLAGQPEIAANILFAGMLSGAFTPKKTLSRYFRKDRRGDWKNARRIINGMDKWPLLAREGKEFLACLKLVEKT